MHPHQDLFDAVKLCQGVDLEPSDLAPFFEEYAIQSQASQRAAWAVRQCPDPWVVKYEIEAGKIGGLAITTVIGGFATGGWSWLGAGIALAGGLLKQFLGPKKPKNNNDDRQDASYGFSGGGDLAPSGTTMAMIYASRSIDPAAGGGVRFGGVLVYSHVETLLGSSTLYLIHAISLGESPTLGYGQLGLINQEQILFNEQPRSNFSDREIRTEFRSGTRNQSPVSWLRFRSQNFTPPDNAAFGVDYRAAIDDAISSTIAPEDTTLATVAGGTITSASTVDAWASAFFGGEGVSAAPALFEFRPTALATMVVGVSSVNTGIAPTSIEYGWQINIDGSTHVIELGVAKTIFYPWAVGDRFGVQVTTAGQIEYLYNDDLIYVSAVTPNLPLYPDVSIYSAGASVVASLDDAAITAETATETVITLREEEETFDRFNFAQDFVKSVTGDSRVDQTFTIIGKNVKASQLTISPSVPLTSRDSIYALWRAKVQTPSHCNRVDFNLSSQLSALESDQSSKKFGEPKSHGSLFDVWMRPANSPLGTEVFVIRLLIVGKRRVVIRRSFRIKDLPLGRYYFELIPCTGDNGERDVWMLTTSGVLAEMTPAVTMAGSAFKVEGEMYLYAPATVGAAAPLAFTNVTETDLGWRSGVGGGSVRANAALTPGESFNWTMRGKNSTEGAHYIGLSVTSAPANAPSYAIGITQAGSIWSWDVYLGGVAMGVGAQLPITGASQAVATRISGTNIIFSVGNQTRTIAIANPADPLYLAAWIPGDDVNTPAIVVDKPAGQGTRERVNEWIQFRKKNQVTSESGPTTKIDSMNLVVYPPAPDSYPGFALLASSYVASERIQRPPAQSPLTEEGREVPNLRAAGEASGLSSATTLNDPTANFIADGILTGWKIRNLRQGIEADISAVAATDIQSATPLNWVQGDDYLIFNIGSTAFFPDILADTARNDFGGIYGLIRPDKELDYPGLVRARKFCVANRFYCNVAYQSPTQWAKKMAEHARQSRLLPVKTNGKWSLRPEQLEEPADVWNASNIWIFRRKSIPWQSRLANQIVARYIDGRDLFSEDGARHLEKTVVVSTPGAYLGTEPLREESLNLETVTYPEQAVSIATTWLSSARLQTYNIELSIGHKAAYRMAGDVVHIQHPLTDVGEELSGGVLAVGTFAGGQQSVLLDCQPVILSGWQAEDGSNGAIYRGNFLETSVNVGDLLVSEECGGGSGIITEITASTLVVPGLTLKEGDSWQVLNLTTPQELVGSVKYGASRAVQYNLAFDFENQSGVIWLKFYGLNQPIAPGDRINLGGEEHLYRIFSMQPSGPGEWSVVATYWPGEKLFDQSQYVIQFDDQVINDPNP
jgi:hypothetical protein